MTDQASTAPAGWYAAPGDPEGSTRYWDGANWTESVSPAAAPMSAPSDSTIDLRLTHQNQPVSTAPTFVPSPAVSEEAPVRRRTAPWKRFAGRVIDSGAYLSAPWIVVLAVGMVAPSWVVGPLGIALYLVLPPVLHFLFLSRLGTTPGKLLLGMAVVANGPDLATSRDIGPLAASPSAKRAVLDMFFGMHFGTVALLAPLSLAPLTVLLAATSLILLFIGPGRTVPDRVAGTVVVDAEVAMTLAHLDGDD